MAPPKKERSSIGADQVLEYLQKHPNFLLQHPELIDLLAPPNRHEEGRKVVDMQHFMLRKLQSDNNKMRELTSNLVHSSRENLTAQQRVHSAAISLLSATCFEDLMNIVSLDLAPQLGIDAVCLGIEADGAGEVEPRVRGVQILDPYYTEELMGSRLCLIRPDVEGDPELFGGSAGLVRSDALVRLYIGDDSPDGLLALGARKTDAFHAFGGELLCFLAQVLEIAIRNGIEREE